MRITAGQLKGAKLPRYRGVDVRPTQGRVREALFSVLGERVIAATVLDLFAGSGAFGFEAISRGAARAVFVDHARDVTAEIGAFAAKFNIADKVTVLPMKAQAAIRKLSSRGVTFDLVFLDPPYASDLITQVTSTPEFVGLFAPSGALIVECRVGVDHKLPHAFDLSFERTYGDTAVRVYELAAEGREGSGCEGTFKA